MDGTKNNSMILLPGIISSVVFVISMITMISLNVLAQDPNTQELNTQDVVSYNNEPRYASAGFSLVFANYYNNIELEQASIQGYDQMLRLVSTQTQEITLETEQTTQVATEIAAVNSTTTGTSVLTEYTTLGVSNVTNYLNVREEPNESAKLVGKLPMNAGCEILEATNGWYKIQSGSVTGYVSGEYLLTGEAANQRALEAMTTVATVTADELRVRSQPNTDSEVIARIARGEELEVVAVSGGWVSLNITGTQAYVSAEFVTIHDTLPKGVTLKELSYDGSVSNTVVDLIEYAKQFLGNPYVYGGSSLTNGTDCSGFTMRIFEHFGYDLNRSSASQVNNGTKVAISEIQPGDLLFYSYGGSIGHVAIYIGNGQIIHASTERTGIIISNAFYSNPTCAVRVIK